MALPENSYEILKGWLIFWSENYMATEFLQNSKQNYQYFDQKIRWPRNCYETLKV